MNPVSRPAERDAVLALLRQSPVVALHGPRQVGKTTLAQEVKQRYPGKSIAYDLEDSSHLAKLSDPMQALAPHRGLVILDEIQRRPELFPTLRVLAGRPGSPARFLILGSASPKLDRLWLRGGFPRSFLASSAAASIRSASGSERSR